MGPEIVLGIASLIITAAASGVGGAFWLQSQGSTRVEKVREEAKEREDKIFSESKEKVDLVLFHVQKVQDAVNDIRAELPTKYVLKEDFYRLSEKVEELKMEFYKVQIKNPNDALKPL